MDLCSSLDLREDDDDESQEDEEQRECTRRHVQLVHSELMASHGSDKSTAARVNELHEK